MKRVFLVVVFFLFYLGGQLFAEGKYNPEAICIRQTIAHDSLNIRELAESYVRSNYFPITDTVMIDTKRKTQMPANYPLNWGWGIYMGGDLSFPTGNLAKYNANSWGFDLSSVFSYKKFALLTTLAFTMGKASGDFILKGIPSQDIKTTSITNLGLTFSYNLYEKKRIKLSPFIGPAWSRMGILCTNTNKINSPYVLGGIIGIQMEVFLFHVKEIFSEFRLPIYFRYSYSFPQLYKYDSFLSGGMQFLSIGIGFFYK